MDIFRSLNLSRARWTESSILKSVGPAGGYVFVYHRGAPCVCTYHYHGREKKVPAECQLLAALIFLWCHKPNISKQYQLMDLLSFYSWVTSTHHSGCFSSVSYSWIVFEGILIIDYHHYMIYLLRKFVWKNHSKFCLLIVQNCVLKL